MVTFKQLEDSKHREHLSAGSALDAWYDSVKSIPIDKLSVRDLAVAVRQHLFLKDVVPVALSFLERDPLAGAQFDGELLAALNSVPITFWSADHVEADRVRKILDRIEPSSEPDIASDVLSIRAKLPQ